MNLPPCPLCASTHPTVERARRGHLRYVQCQTCTLTRLHPAPDPAEAETFDKSYFVGGQHRDGYMDYEAEKRWHMRTAAQRLARLERSPLWQHSESPRLVDVGTAVGYLPEVALARGWLVPGTVECSNWAAGRARGRGLRVEKALSDLRDLAGGVDAVTFFQVLEHMTEPTRALRDAAHLLRSGGIVACETWDASSRTARLAGSRWQQFSAPSVLWAFTPSSAGRMLSDSGLRLLSWRHTRKTVGLSTILGQASPRWTAPGTRRLARATSSIGVPYPLDDLVTFIAIKD